MVLKWFGFCDMVLATQIRVKKARAPNAEGVVFGCWPCPARGQTRIADLIWDQQRQETMPDVPTQPVWVIVLPEKT